MSKPQSLGDIGPMKEQQVAPSENEVTDPIQKEFDEGKAFLERNELGQAAIAFHNVLLAREEQEDTPGIANASNQLGHVCLARKEFEQAVKHYKRAWDICDTLDDPMSLNALSRTLIDAYVGQKDYKQAVNCCFDLLDTFRLNNDPRGSVEILERMADIFLESGDNVSAADAYKTVASIHRNFKHESIAQSFEDKAKELL